MVIPLKTLMENLEDNILSEILSSFSCIHDADIEGFLHNRAIIFETLSKARTYLVFNLDDFINHNECPVVYGYIALALKILTVPPSISNRMRKELDGFNAKIHGKQIDDFPCYLIGQMSKNSNAPESIISGTDLLNIAFDIIASAVQAVGGRYVMIECHDEEKLLSFYSHNLFAEIDRTQTDDMTMVQMIRKI